MSAQRIGLLELTNEIEKSISHSIGTSVAGAWDENHITYKWLENVTEALNGKTIETTTLNRTIRCSAFKLTGKPERTHGDVAIITRIVFDDGDALEGVGFLEAKKRDKTKDSFPALDPQQLTRIYAGTDYAKVLLYDWEPIIPGSTINNSHSPWIITTLDTDFIGVSYQPTKNSNAPTTHATVVAMDTVFDPARSNRKAYRFSLPLSQQICHRYLMGLDLDLQPSSIKTARGYARKHLIPTMLMTLAVRVSLSDASPPDMKPPNPKWYEPFAGHKANEWHKGEW